jgi:metal-responsive CopG/Arc/MetJ family transcriptional regulator
MKTAISIPDDVYVAAEQLTRRLKKTRSQLYTEAVRDYLARHDAVEVTDALNRVYEPPEPHVDEAASAAARRLLEQVEW